MIGRPELSGQLALDANGLGQLRAAARDRSPEAVRETARQFEAMLLNMMLKSMRAATPQEGMFDNDQTRTYTAMLDQQLSQTLAAKGTGLAEVLIRQLSAVTGTLPADEGLRATDWNAAPAQRSGGVWAKDQPEHVTNFQRSMLPHAQAASRSSGIPAHFMVGQAALESGWGRHQIRYADGRPSYNLFGIKATGGWSGKVVEAVTSEYIDGKKSRRVEQFRAYDSYAESFKDFAALIGGSSRYQEAIRQVQHLPGYARALQQAGYATDPDYADKLIKIVQQMTVS